jgi:hypothetical protein
MHLYQRHYELVKNMLTEPFYSDRIPELNFSIVEEHGMVSSFGEWKEIFEPITKGLKPDFNKIKMTGNNLIDWCIKTLKEKK